MGPIVNSSGIVLLYADEFYVDISLLVLYWVREGCIFRLWEIVEVEGDGWREGLIIYGRMKHNCYGGGDADIAGKVGFLNLRESQ